MSRRLWDGGALVDPPWVSFYGDEGIACSIHHRPAVYARSRAASSADADAPSAMHPALVCRTAASEYGLEYEGVPGGGHMLRIEKPVAAGAALRRLLASLRRS